MEVRDQVPQSMLTHYKNLLSKRPDYKDLSDPSSFSFSRFDAYLSLVSWVDGNDASNVDLSSMLSGGLLAQAKMMQSLGFFGHFGATVDVRKYMLNFPGSKLTLLWIPKNSCTSVKRMLIKYEPEDLQKRIAPHRFHETCQEQFGLTLPEFSNGKTYPKIAIIRHPYERVVSCYLDKFVKPVIENKPFEGFVEGHIKAIHKLLGTGGDLRRSVSFCEFVFYIFQQPVWSYDAHWRPQSNFIYGYDKSCILIPIENIQIIDSILGVQGKEMATNRSYGKKFSEADGFVGEFSELLPGDIKRADISSYNQFISRSLGFMLNAFYSKDIELYNMARQRLSEAGAS